jgi:TIR domain
MKIFLSHASRDAATSESIAFSLSSRGYKVFLDRDDLPAGASYDQRIERAVKDSEIFIFLISPDSVAEGRYTLTELTFARQKWADPNGRVLPVLARKTPFEQIPRYLKAVTVLEPVGNITAETSAAVDNMRHGGFVRGMKRDAPELFARYRYVLAFAAIGGVVMLAFMLFASKQPDRSTGINTGGAESPVVQGTQGDVNINFSSPTAASPVK